MKERESLIVGVVLLDSTSSHRAGVEILLKRAVTFLESADARRWGTSVRDFARHVPPFAKTVPFPTVAAPEVALCAPRLRTPLHVQIHDVWIGTSLKISVDGPERPSLAYGASEIDSGSKNGGKG